MDSQPVPSNAQSAPAFAVHPRDSRRRAFPFYPLLFAIFPSLLLYAHNFAEIPIRQALPPAGTAALACTALWLLFLAVTRHVRRAALAAAILATAFFSYGHLVNLMPAALRPFALPVVFLAALGGAAAALRSRRALTAATAALNLAGVILVAPSLWAIASNWPVVLVVSAYSGPTHASRVVRRQLLNPPDAAQRPDVYFIVLDAYGRDDTLREFYGVDNEPFLKELEKRGFYIARGSHANYDQTTLCLASALNMNYLDGAAMKAEPPIRLRQIIDDNAVATHLSRKGLHYVYIWTGAAETRVTSADVVLAPKDVVAGFEDNVMGLSALSADPNAQARFFDLHREYIVAAFQNLRAAARLPYPKFVFAHIMAPHPPFVFGPHGEPVYPRLPFGYADASSLLEAISREDYRRGYAAQLPYINRQVLFAIDGILKTSRKPPIIIVQGDHGSRMNLDWKSLGKTVIREPFSILNAYYVPPEVRSRLYRSISPVNSFRVILTHAFGGDYAPLADRSFYSPLFEPFDFSDVTSQLLPRE